MRLYRFCSLLASLGMLTMSVATAKAQESGVSRTSYGWANVQAEDGSSPSDKPYAGQPAHVDNGACCQPSCNPCCTTNCCDSGCGIFGGGGGGGGGWCANPIYLMPEDGPFRVSGWFQGGFHNKPTPLSQTYGDLRAFNDVPGKFNIHQAYMFAERAADGEANGFDWGFRFDALYGTDAQKTQAFGQPSGWDTDWDHGVYGWALPQAYAEVAAGPLSIKVGKFYTIIGYEVVTAPGNFFYSHSLTMFNSEPFTHTGALGTLNVGDGVNLYGGWTAGWNTGFDQFNGGSNFLGGASVEVNDWLTLAYTTTIGNFGDHGRDGYMGSLVAQVQLTERWQYVVQSDYLDVGQPSNPDLFHHTLGVNQYMFYHFNDCVAWGNRLEWWKAEGTSYWEATTGMNLKAHANWVFRPEIRYDWQGDPNREQWTFGIDTYVLW
jgi:hypothetical protein